MFGSVTTATPETDTRAPMWVLPARPTAQLPSVNAVTIPPYIPQHDKELGLITESEIQVHIYCIVGTNVSNYLFQQALRPHPQRTTNGSEQGGDTAPSSIHLHTHSLFVRPTEAALPPDVMRQYREVHSGARRYPCRPIRCGYRQKTSQVLPSPLARIGITGAWHSLYHDGIQTRSSQPSENRIRGKPHPQRAPKARVAWGGCHYATIIFRRRIC